MEIARFLCRKSSASSPSLGSPTPESYALDSSMVTGCTLTMSSGPPTSALAPRLGLEARPLFARRAHRQEAPFVPYQSEINGGGEAASGGNIGCVPVDSAPTKFSYCGEVPERSNGAVSKTVVPLAGDRGFESLPLRQ